MELCIQSASNYGNCMIEGLHSGCKEPREVRFRFFVTGTKLLVCVFGPPTKGVDVYSDVGSVDLTLAIERLLGRILLC